MFVLVLPFIVGLTVNTLNDHPKNCHDVRTSIVKQFTHPVKSPAVPFNQ